MRDTPLVSIKMITYNHEPYIENAIRSILDQKTEFSFELVIGEDCSTDTTRELVFSYQKKFPEIIRVVTSEENIGMCANGIRTERACRGKYIAFCEGDDYWHNPLKLQKQVEFLENHPEYGLIHSNCDFYNVNTKKLYKSQKLIPAYTSNDDAYLDILTRKRIIRTPTVCLKKDLLFDVIDKNPECSDGRFLMGDLPRWLEISRLTKFKYFDESLATVNVLPESASRSRDPGKNLLFALATQRLIYHYTEKYGCDNEVAKQAIHRTIVDVLYRACFARDSDTAKLQISKLKETNFDITLKNYLFYVGSKNQILCSLVKLLWFVRHEVMAYKNKGDQF